jgi:hypothetical protein
VIAVLILTGAAVIVDGSIFLFETYKGSEEESF